MKTSTLLLLGGFLAVALFAVVQIAGARYQLAADAPALSGERVTRTYDLPALRHLDFEGPIRLILTAGLPSVTIEGDRAIVDALEDEDDVPDKFTINVPRARRDLSEADMLVARVSSPSLRRVQMSGRNDLQSAAPLDYRYLDLDFAGGTTVDLDLVRVDSLYVDASGSLRGMLRGAGGFFDVSTSGSSDLDASSLEVSRAEVDMSGSGHLRIHVDSLMDVSGSGSSKVEYTGRARVNSRMSGSGSVVDVGEVM